MKALLTKAKNGHFDLTLHLVSGGSPIHPATLKSVDAVGIVMVLGDKLVAVPFTAIKRIDVQEVAAKVSPRRKMASYATVRKKV